MDKLDKIIEEIGQLTVLELNDLIKRIEDKFGVKAIQPFAPASVQEVSKEKEEKETVNVVLKDAGSQKIQVIKALRDLTGLSLMECKGICDKVPTNVKEDIPKIEAEGIKTKIEEAGGIVELK